MTPGLLAKYGLGYDHLKQINPRLIMCSVSGLRPDRPNGATACHGRHRAVDLGVMSLTGNPDGMPAFSGIYMADGNAGVNTIRGNHCGAVLP